jgi:hypothetical protein
LDPLQEAGYGEYTFSVPVSGTYVGWGRVLANSRPDGSFFASMDDGAYAVWETQHGGEWWNSSYTLRKKITITAGSTAIPTDYTVSFTEDTATLITKGQVRSDGNDWRIVYWNGSSWVELDRWVDDIVGDGWDSATTVTWFKTQAAIGASSADDNYYLYYGYSGETQSPPASMSDSMGADTASDVFWYADDFEEHGDSTDPDGWTDQGTEDFLVTSHGSERWFQIQT